MRDPQAEAQRWLAAAGEELAWAHHAAAGGFHAPACFHAQQGAEKAVKAVHYLRGARVVIGHNVRALIENLDPRVPALDALADAGRELDLLYIPTRYPNGLSSGTPGEAFSASQSQRALEHATAIIEAAVPLVEPPAPPVEGEKTETDEERVDSGAVPEQVASEKEMPAAEAPEDEAPEGAPEREIPEEDKPGDSLVEDPG